MSGSSIAARMSSSSCAVAIIRSPTTLLLQLLNHRLASLDELATLLLSLGQRLVWISLRPSLHWLGWSSPRYPTSDRWDVRRGRFQANLQYRRWLLPSIWPTALGTLPPASDSDQAASGTASSDCSGNECRSRSNPKIQENFLHITNLNILRRVFTARGPVRGAWQI